MSQVTDQLKHLVPFLLIALLLLSFGVIANAVIESSTTAFDNAILLALRNDELSNPIGPAWVRSMARDITALGSIVVLSIVSSAIVGYLLLVRKTVSAWLVLVAVLGGGTLNSLLKIVFERQRPDIAGTTELLTASFPSGHAALSAITYLTLAALLARTTTSRGIRSYFVAVGVLLTVLVGASRVYLGVHYPTDVLAGWCLGSAWALGCWAVFSVLQQKGAAEPPGNQPIN